MIDEQRTFEIYGYTSGELKPHSHKPIVAVCEECGKYRDLSKDSYRVLCLPCANKKQWEDPAACKKASISQIKRWDNIEERKKMSETQIKRYEDPLEREKTSVSSKKHWSDQAVRDKQSKSLKKYYEDPSARKKTSKANKKRYENPLERKKLSEAQIKRFEDPNEHEKASVRMSGENNHQWLGGISYGKYCPKFNNVIKQYIRDKYNNCDYIGGLSDTICNSGRKLDVHHVDYNKEQGCDEHEWRLIPLSKSHHAITNRNRSFWNRLFTYALQYDETYYDDELIDAKHRYCECYKFICDLYYGRC